MKQDLDETRSETLERHDCRANYITLVNTCTSNLWWLDSNFLILKLFFRAFFIMVSSLFLIRNMQRSERGRKQMKKPFYEISIHSVFFFPFSRLLSGLDCNYDIKWSWHLRRSRENKNTFHEKIKKMCIRFVILNKKESEKMVMKTINGEGGKNAFIHLKKKKKKKKLL